ncbi:hypothetical protein [Thermanaeromonas sp. C210]|uniref:hypothetical protein n=1 Tax=Thermanaeromonas sp. C210 TaxID=2731925 RepID=UPI00155CD1F9|nr:hypothetical protein [Thermanaeromonas sp. C210]GFN23688.1 hypothetical protein TAMC210_20050 [Thermanaeromonas sp. C210]
MFLKAEIRKGEYYDSVKLMLVTQQLSSMDGIEEAAVQMGTNLNKEVLRNMGMLAPELEEATADDLMISIKGISEKAVDQALKQVDLLLSQRGSKDESYDYRPRSFDAAMKACPDLNLCIISVPGRYAKREAMKALEKGLHVMLFSDNVALEDELELKIYARNHNLLLMGPDCGTAMLNNIPLGFANKVRRGKIGIVGASGTGTQEVMTLIHKRGGGVSHAIGTGSRDLRSEIGGITTLQGLEGACPKRRGILVAPSFAFFKPFSPSWKSLE